MGGGDDHSDNDPESMLTQLESTVKESAAELEQLRNQRDQQAEEISQLHQEKDKLSGMLNARNHEVQALSSDIETHSHTGARIAELEHIVAEKDAELAEIHNQRNEAQWILGERTAEVESLKTGIFDLEKLLEDRNQELDGLRFEHEGVTFNIDQFNQLQKENQQLTARNGELEHWLSERDGELNHLRHEKQELENRVTNETDPARIQELEWLLGERDGQLEETRNQLWSNEHKKGERIAELEWILGERDADLERLRGENTHLKEEVEGKNNALNEVYNGDSAGFVSRIQELEWLLGERDGDLGRIREETSHLHNQISERDKSLQERDSEREKQHARIHELESEINQLRQELTENKTEAWRIQELESLVQEQENHLENLNTEPLTLQSLFTGEDVTEDRSLGMLYREAPSRIDNLKEINGIAEGIEKQLNEIGVYRFRQIALWNQHQITEFGERLAFKDRIGRDQWVAQALDLHRRDYGESLPPQIDLYLPPIPVAKPKRESTSARTNNQDLPVITEENAFTNDPIRIDRMLGPIFSSRPEQVDDMSKLADSTDHFVDTLHNLGIYRYKQIALWTPRQLQQFSLLLNVNGNGRIDFEYWIEQAAELHKEKYHQLVQRSRAVGPKKPKKVNIGKLVDHPDLGFIYEIKPDNTDDLTRINGVGPNLENDLNNLGIYCFHQIAHWSKEIEAEFAKKIPLGDRISRENWIQQAKELAANKVDPKI